jgi:hypothetical protein
MQRTTWARIQIFRTPSAACCKAMSLSELTTGIISASNDVYGLISVSSTFTFAEFSRVSSRVSFGFDVYGLSSSSNDCEAQDVHAGGVSGECSEKRLLVLCLLAHFCTASA